MLLTITLILCLMAIAFPDKKDTMYGCIISMWKFVMWFFILLFMFCFIGAMLGFIGGDVFQEFNR